MHGDAHNPGRAVRRLAANVVDSTSLDAVMTGLARTATVSLRAPWVHLRVGDRTAIDGRRPEAGATHTVELTAGEREVGTLEVAFGPGRRFTDRDKAVIAELADHGARAVYAVQLADELRTSRHLLITAREEERSRLRRDLHDELGPTMASLAMQLAGLEEIIRADPATAAARVPQLEQAARASLEDVRRVARALRPPALDELGLAGALRQGRRQCGPPAA